MTYRLIDKAVSREAQAFFKSLPGEYFEKDSGNVEAPTCWFGLVEVDKEIRDLYLLDTPDEPVPDEVADGRYLVQIDNNGIVWAYQTDTDATDLGVEYMRLEQEFARWDRQDSDHDSIEEVFGHE